jgi:hypothetical protein
LRDRSPGQVSLSLAGPTQLHVWWPSAAHFQPETGASNLRDLVLRESPAFAKFERFRPKNSRVRMGDNPPGICIGWCLNVVPERQIYPFQRQVCHPSFVTEGYLIA